MRQGFHLGWHGQVIYERRCAGERIITGKMYFGFMISDFRFQVPVSPYSYRALRGSSSRPGCLSPEPAAVLLGEALILSEQRARELNEEK